MLFKNANIFVGGQFQHGSFRVENGRFAEILTTVPAEDGIDLENQYVIPGLVDVHNHGNSGADFSDGDYDGLIKMARYLAQNGVTSFAPASMTLPYDVLEAAYKTAVQLKKAQPEGCAHLMGIQMEGPFFSEKKKGAQNGAYLRDPDFAAFQQLYDASEGLIRIADVTAELPGAVEFAEKASKLCTVSIAHTDCTYEEASAVLDAGASHLTHLYNAMPGIHHRKPGPIGAGSERENVVAELICDGQHIHPSAVRMAFRLFPGRICLISDALRCCGMPDGQYTLGGQDVFLYGGVAKLADGTLAESPLRCALKYEDNYVPIVCQAAPGMYLIIEGETAVTKTLTGTDGRQYNISSPVTQYALATRSAILDPSVPTTPVPPGIWRK